MAKTKFYTVHGECIDSHGDKHTVTLVGQLDYLKETVQVDTDLSNDTYLTRMVKVRKKRLSIGMAICHKWDEFDLEFGQRLAKKRIKRGESIGTLETANFSMLTDDSVNAELLVKLSHITANIERYIPSKESETLTNRYEVGTNRYNVTEASENDIIELLNAADNETEFIIGEGKTVKKDEIYAVMREVMEKLRQETAHEEPAQEAEAPA